jgi:diguanylate cyclase (GGDEF)-like protein
MTAHKLNEAVEIPGARRLSWSVASVGSLSVIALGAVVLLAWAIRSELLQSFGAGPLGMKVNAAICFVLLGAAVFARRRAGALRHLAQRTAGVVVVTVGALTGLEYLLGIDLGLDQLVFADPTSVLDTPPGRMAPLTALCFVLLGATLLSRSTLSSRHSMVSTALIPLAALLAFIAFVGHIYDANALYGAFTQMTLETSVGLMVLCIAALAIAPQDSVSSLLLRATAGGVVARRLVPAAVLVPITIGGAVLWGERAGLYDGAFSVLLMVVTIVLAFAGIGGWIAWTLDHERSRRISAERSADTDALTGLGSRRAIVAQLERMVEGGRPGDSFSLLAIDGDGLKQINDRSGHAAGDAALLRLGEVIVATLRDSDIVGRTGGDEFLALLPGTSGAEAQVVASRLREALMHAGPAHLRLTASIGVGEWSKGVSAGELLLAADRALYEDKRTSALAS